MRRVPEMALRRLLETVLRGQHSETAGVPFGTALAEHAPSEATLPSSSSSSTETDAEAATPDLPHETVLHEDSSTGAETIPGHSAPSTAADPVQSDESPRWQPGSTLRRRLQDLTAIQLPGQSNRMALVFDPLNDPVRPQHLDQHGFCSIACSLYLLAQ